MAKQFDQIQNVHQSFIEQQKVFFVGTAGAEGKVNVSPKGMDSFRVVGPNRVIWLSVTGSGNESAAHVAENGRMTVMFCSFEGAPQILRLYGKAKTIYPRHEKWNELSAEFPDIPGARQIFDLSVDLVQTSCGMSVPQYDYKSDRTALNEWAKKKGPDGIADYWNQKNRASIDGMPTHILQ